MNTRKKHNITAIRSRMVLRLWSFMMMIVLFAVGSMWIMQIYLFEQNYTKAALSDTMHRLQPVMNRLSTEDLADDEHVFFFLSHITDGDVILFSQEGKIMQMYSSGHPVNTIRKTEEQHIWEAVTGLDEFQNLLDGRPYTIISRHQNRIVGYELGLPVTYSGERCYVILHNMLMLETTLKLNRRQLITMSILLTAAASVLAAVLSRQFTKPLYQIKGTVDNLAGHDFSARPRLERSDEFGQLSHSVEELGRELQRVDVLRKEVIANVSHELRSPLAVIGGYAEMVRDITWKDEEQRTEDLNLIISESRRMSDMVSDILDYSQFQAGYTRLKKSWYNLCDILESEVAACQKSAAEYHIRLELEYCRDGAAPETGSFREDIPLEIDALKISQVIRNLLYNAINHTQENGTIRITTEKEPGSVLVSVRNPGPPIPDEERKVIWERYQRSQHQSGRRLGTGIGLSIVSTILEAHGMEYGVDCRDGWIIFWFRAGLSRDGSNP